MNYLNWGLEVIDAEIAALQAIRNQLDVNFTNAVRAIKSCKGKVIITGIGKSGHIARKMAATMASLGTPSFFLHSSEALHGDTGMIQSRDLVIAISNSGKTREVVETASKARQIGTRVIAMTGQADSPLAQQSDIVLDIHVSGEADHLNLAPTSSSTVTLAVGDALAVASSRAKSFTKENFAFIHAGGELGKRSSNK